MIITEHFAVKEDEINYVRYELIRRYVPNYVERKFLFIFDYEIDEGDFKDFHLIHINFKNGKTTTTKFEDFEECKIVLGKLVNLFSY